MRGQVRLRRWAAAALALTVLGVVGCDSEAARYNNTLAEYNRRLYAAGRQLGQSMRPSVQGGRVDTDQVRASYEAAWETVKEIKKEFATLQPPPSATGKKFHESYARFLRGQETMIRDDFGRIVRMLERPDRARSAGQELVRIAQNALRREQQNIAELQQVQREFCREHQLPLPPVR